ncbi:tetratricopeptide repeat protein [candidate division KSB1 bacterium]|nr:tetratricopeptide repeat protein [candidate division KSB1 bacterium]
MVGMDAVSIDRRKSFLGLICSALSLNSKSKKKITMYRSKLLKKIIFLSILIAFSVLPAQDFPNEFLNGQIKTIDSKILQKERTIFIYLPTDYDDTTRKYPVHYVTDAPATANLYFDIQRVHTFVNAMPSSIVVGLSSDNREYHMHPDKGAKLYMDFLRQEVVPFIDTNYRTHPFRTIAGHSLGGGFSIYTFLSNMDLFNACIAGSPYPLEFLSDLASPQDLFKNMSDYRFFFSSIGTEKDVSEGHFKQFQNILIKNAPQNLDYLFTIHKGEDHISNIALNFQNGLKSLYSDWTFVLPDTLDKPIDRLLTAHYQKLSEKMGYPIEPDQWKVIFPLMDTLAKQGNFKSAIRLLTYGIDLYPQSDQAYAFLARAYMSTGKIDSAKSNIDKALSINPQNSYALELKDKLNN